MKKQTGTNQSIVRILPGNLMATRTPKQDQSDTAPLPAAAARAASPGPLLEIIDLSLAFPGPRGNVIALDGISLSVARGETVCLVGESGSGKSLTALSIARLVPSPPARVLGGQIRIEGRDVLSMSNGELRRIRGGVVSYVFQEPGASLNPVMRIGRQIMESLRLHRPEAAASAEVIRLLRLVGIPAPESRMDDFPHQLSGGMQQRVFRTGSSMVARTGLPTGKRSKPSVTAGMQ
jgi:ABC-type dipeptide/oligopeptide/nickel transport system ATPase component